MRATISLLVSGLLLGALFIDHQVIASLLPDQILSTVSSRMLLSAKPEKPGKPKNPKNPPYRGSGRREMTHFRTTAPAV